MRDRRHARPPARPVRPATDAYVRSARSGGSAPCRRDHRICAFSRRRSAASALIRLVAQQDRDEALVPDLHIVPTQRAFALAGAALAEAEQAAQARIGGPVGGIDEKRRAIREIEPASDHEPDARLLGGLMRAHDPGQRIAIGDAERRDAQELRLLEQFARARCAAQKRVMRRDLKFGVAHAKIPCSHQRPP